MQSAPLSWQSEHVDVQLLLCRSPALLVARGQAVQGSAIVLPLHCLVHAQMEFRYNSSEKRRELCLPTVRTGFEAKGYWRATGVSIRFCHVWEEKYVVHDDSLRYGFLHGKAIINWPYSVSPKGEGYAVPRKLSKRYQRSDFEPSPARENREKICSWRVGIQVRSETIEDVRDKSRYPIKHPFAGKDTNTRLRFRGRATLSIPKRK